jgi:hypothetical protein
LDVNWIREVRSEDLKPALMRYNRYLEDLGLRKSTITSYVLRVGKFLAFAQGDAPQVEDFTRFREMLLDHRLSRSSINNYCFAIKSYYKMCGQSVDFNFVRHFGICLACVLEVWTAIRRVDHSKYFN